MGSDLHNGRGQIGEQGGGAVEAAQAGVAAVDMCPAVFPAENRPFVEDRQTLHGGGAGSADHGIRQDPVIEGQVDAVVVAVKSHRLHIDIGGNQLRTADPGVGCGIQNGLGAGG